MVTVYSVSACCLCAAYGYTFCVVTRGLPVLLVYACAATGVVGLGLLAQVAWHWRALVGV